MAAKKTTVVRDSIEEAMAALKKTELVPLRFDTLNAKAACNTGLKALKKFEPVLARDFKGFNLDELHELPELCERLRVAQREVEQAGGRIEHHLARQSVEAFHDQIAAPLYLAALNHVEKATKSPKAGVLALVCTTSEIAQRVIELDATNAAPLSRTL